MKRRMVLIFLFVVVDVLGFSLILPLLPYYARTFGASSFVVGLLVASNAVTQLVGAPVIGRLSDRYGRRPLLILSISGTVASFFLLGIANSLWLLFLSRALDGLLGGNVSLARAYITDVTDEENRARGMGLIGAAFGLGFTVGPALGGFLSAGGNYSLPAFVAMGLAAINLVGVLLWLPESLPPEERGEEDRRSRFKALLEALQRKCVGPLLRTRLFYSLAATMFQTIFSLYAMERLGLDAQTTGYVLTYVGVLIVLIQGGGIGWLTERFSEKQLALWAMGLMALSLLGWALVPTLWALITVLFPLSVATGILNTLLSSLLSKAAHRDEVGGVLGLESSLGSLTRAISPVVGGFFIQEIGAWAPGVAGAAIMVGVLAYARHFLPQLPEPLDSNCGENAES